MWGFAVVLTAPPAAWGRPVAQGFVFSAAALWAVSGLVIKGLLDAGLGALEIAFWRALLGGGMFWLHGSLKRSLRLQTPTDLGILAGFAFFGVALHFVSFNFAVQYGGVSLAVLCVASSPALVALGAWMLLGESMPHSKVLLIGAGVFGLALVASAGEHHALASVPALLWGGVAALTVASYDLVSKWLLRRYTPVVMSAFLMPLSALGLLPFVSFTVKTPHHWLLFALLAGVSTYLGHLLYQTGLQRLEASRAALLVSVEPVIAVALAVLVLGEPLALPGLLGAGLILGALALMNLLSTKDVRTVRGGVNLREPPSIQQAVRSESPALVCKEVVKTLPTNLSSERNRL